MLLKILLAIPIIAAIALAGIFYNGYQDVSKEAETLEKKVQADRTLEQTLSQKARDLAGQIDALNLNVRQLQASLDEASLAVPEKMNSNDILEKILKLGREYLVSVIPLNSRDWSTAKIGQHDYQVFRMDLSLEGTQEDIVDFLKEMQSELYPTLVVEDVSLSKSVAPVTTTPVPSATPTTLRVETLPATDVRDVSAVLNGNLLGLDTHGVFYVNFEYGETDNYTGSTVFDAVYHPGKFSYTLTGLAPETLYHFRATVQGNEKIYGADLTFKTLAAWVPPVPLINASVSLAIYAR
jgi:Tfp pilus assembly protein PilO